MNVGVYMGGAQVLCGKAGEFCKKRSIVYNNAVAPVDLNLCAAALHLGDPLRNFADAGVQAAACFLGRGAQGALQHGVVADHIIAPVGLERADGNGNRIKRVHLAPQIMHAFIHDEQTVALGTVYLRARCFAPIMMFLCFHMVHYMQALGKGGVSLALAAIRQLGMNIPLLFLLDHFFGMTGIIWTQVTADALTAVISYLIYAHVKRGLEVPDGTKTEST